MPLFWAHQESSPGCFNVVSKDRLPAIVLVAPAKCCRVLLGVWFCGVVASRPESILVARVPFWKTLDVNNVLVSRHGGGGFGLTHLGSYVLAISPSDAVTGDFII